MQIKIYPPPQTTLTEDLKDVVKAFESKKDEIDSTTHEHWTYEDVLSIVRGRLEELDYQVKNGRAQRVQLPVTDHDQYDVDAYNYSTRIAVDIEAGQAWMNNAFLRDIVDVGMMRDVDHLVLAVPIKCNGTNPFRKIREYLDTFYENGRISLPLKTIVIIGY